jgi:hypothetical protein
VIFVISIVTCACTACSPIDANTVPNMTSHGLIVVSYSESRPPGLSHNRKAGAVLRCVASGKTNPRPPLSSARGILTQQPRQLDDVGRDPPLLRCTGRTPGAIFDIVLAGYGRADGAAIRAVGTSAFTNVEESASS